MEDTNRIIHNAVWINYGTKLLFLKAFADIVGKTRTDKQHTLQRTYAECRFIYIYFCSEFHYRQNIISIYPNFYFL